MVVQVVMPKLGFIMTEGTVVEWVKKPGDPVEKGEIILIIESEKANVDVVSPGTGILGPDLAPPGTTVEVGTPIGYILRPGEEPPPLAGFGSQAAARGEVQMPAEARRSATREPAGKPGQAPPAGRVVASPSAKRLAQEHGVDLAQVTGTGPQGRIVDRDVLAFAQARDQSEKSEKEGAARISPVAQKMAMDLGIDVSAVQGSGLGGRITVEDVKRASQAPAPAAEQPSEIVELTRIQQLAAERMSLSFKTAPHFYLSVEVDMTQATAMRETLSPGVEAKTGIRLSFSDVLVFVVARALQKHPDLNAAFEDGRLKRYREVHIALAVDTPHGLTVPVFHQADAASLAEISRRRAELVEKAQGHRLTYDDVSLGTFTISNLGMFGIDVFHAIINPPQAAILAVGRIAKRPVVVDDALQVRPTMWLTLSVDHRAADGATAARFMQTLVDYLENPYQHLV